jgi:hypothetical protein
MLSNRAITRLTLLAPLVIGAACSSRTSQPCTWCDSGKSDWSDDLALIPDVESSAAVVDQAEAPQAEAPQAEAPIDQAQQSDLGGTETLQTDAPLVDAARPSPVPDGGVLLSSDFEDGTTDGWRTQDWNDAGLPDSDWSVFQGDTGYVYSEGVLDDSEWHIAFADSAAIADQIVEARMRVVEFYGAAPSFVGALFARFDPNRDSGYFVALRGDGSVIIRKRLNGKSASWAAGVDAGIVPGTWYTVRLEVVGNTASAFVDGKPVYSVVDSDPLTTGTAGLGSYGATLEVDRIFLAQP